MIKVIDSVRIEEITFLEEFNEICENWFQLFKIIQFENQDFLAKKWIRNNIINGQKVNNLKLVRHLI